MSTTVYVDQLVATLGMDRSSIALQLVVHTLKAHETAASVSEENEAGLGYVTITFEKMSCFTEKNIYYYYYLAWFILLWIPYYYYTCQHICTRQYLGGAAKYALVRIVCCSLSLNLLE